MENQALATSPGGPWNRVLEVLRDHLKPGEFETWFRPTSYHSHDGETLRVAVPNEMFVEWIRSRYLPAILDALPRAGIPASRVEFVPSSAPAPEPGGSATPARPASPAPADVRLNPKYTFENFVVSSCNQFAHAAALAVADQPGRTYNPLYVYGGVGLGKTHLMQAIGNRLLRTRPGARLRYLTSEQFVNELIHAIRFKDTAAFRDRYRSVDVLLVDDIQFLAGKESTQEEFFHTFNALYDAGRQIVITSDCPPRQIRSLEERLRSRFEWGLIADIQPPDLETKVAILRKMAARRQWDLPSDVALYLAGQVKSNIRELEGCLITLMASASLRHEQPSLKLAREVLRMLLPAEPEPVSLDAIIRVVARRFDLKVSEIKSKTNSRHIAFPRQVAMYLGKKLAGKSLPQIGQAFGGKHHTTVLHAVRKIENLAATDPALQKMLTDIEEELR